MVKEAYVDRAEAVRLLELGTRFQFVGDRVLVRNVALIEALSEVTAAQGDAGLHREHEPARDTTLVLAA